jgi:hypothetical protein
VDRSMASKHRAGNNLKMSRGAEILRLMSSEE